MWALALLSALLFISGCATGPSSEGSLFSHSAHAAEAAPAGPLAFTIDIKAPDNIKQYLGRHLELQRYRELTDLDIGELRRLLSAADTNARELLGTLGFFSPDIAIELKETPGDAAAPRQVVITIAPGPAVKIGSVDIGFEGPIVADAASAAQRQSIRDLWLLRPGLQFTQAEWDDAKTLALRLLTGLRYPTGRVAESRAGIDTDTKSAALSLKLDSGPGFRFGPMQVTGLNHYKPELIERLARIPAGADYDQQRLLEAQQRVADSGYFDSVFMSLDTSADDPLTAPVLTQVREAKLQKIIIGVGISTDSGPRVSLEHTHHQLPVIGWRSVSKLTADKATQSLGTELTAQPDSDYWRWATSALLERKDSNGVITNSERLRLGKNQTGERIDRNYYVQYDNAHDRGVALDTKASSVTLNYAWTQRKFDSTLTPSRGYGLGVELGVGTTLGTQKDPFFRTRTTWASFVPLGAQREADGSRVLASRLALRAEGGAVLGRAGADIPSTQLFFAGGDNSVRGYGLRDIGVTSATGQISAGRYLAVGSVEWQRPIIYKGKLTDWESTVFVDAGAVADKPAELKAKVGVGVGARWRSPVGPLQVDLAYGVQVHRLRLHMTVGFTF
jgi:translocation and assembly module TamA